MYILHICVLLESVYSYQDQLATLFENYSSKFPYLGKDHLSQVRIQEKMWPFPSFASTEGASV